LTAFRGEFISGARLLPKF